ncbi:LysE family transporter [Curtobacterium sp. MWU13-2055]|uniref:LysE/ArgO family amino acid transporter n=1 Tax=Curtobacterium sp. MWU13-2055 TaxID=2931928 RepID=UPI00200D7467|nr:LysE family transporter [Curtobacterium sp. MWU13-2055]
MTALLPLLAGLGTGLALIVAIGVQNTYLLRLAVSSGLRVVTAAVVVCAVSDAVLIVAGVLGVGAVVERFPVALVVVRFVGAAFLVTYGVLAARRALRPSSDAMRVADEAAADDVTIATRVADQAADDGVPEPAAGSEPERPGTVVAGRTRTAPPGQAVTMRTAVVTMLVFTWANPHVYLDTLVFLGSVANQQGPDDRWLWTVGAVAASCLWFGALGFGGRLLRPLFAKPLTWRVFDGLVAVVMLGFGVLLVVGA